MPTSEHAGGGEVVLHAGGDGGDAIADVRTTERRGGGIVILHAGGGKGAHDSERNTRHEEELPGSPGGGGPTVSEGNIALYVQPVDVGGEGTHVPEDEGHGLDNRGVGTSAFDPWHTVLVGTSTERAEEASGGLGDGAREVVGDSFVVADFPFLG